MKQIKVTCCADCKFREAINLDYRFTIKHYCTLEHKEIGIGMYTNLTEDWCPLLKDDYQITHKEKRKK